MEVYIIPIIIALSICFVLANLFSLPWMFYQYRKYGYFSFWKTLLLISFIFYSLSALFLVIYPLPPTRNNCPTDGMVVLPQWQLFQFVSDIERETKVVWTDFSTYGRLFSGRALYQVLFNILLLFPLGVYIRYFVKKKSRWWLALLAGLFVSLFFELTQLTGLYGYYDCPYRLFDVDDLLTNTTGAIFGFFFASVFLSFIPSREQLQQQVIYFEQKKYASFGAQVFEVFVSCIFACLMSPVLLIAIGSPFSLLRLMFCFVLSLFILQVLVPFFFKGETLSTKLLKLKFIPIGERPFFNYLRRFIAIHFPLFLFLLALVMVTYVQDELIEVLFAIGLIGIASIVSVIILVYLVVCWFKKEQAPYFNRYGKIIVERVTKCQHIGSEDERQKKS